VLLDGTVFCHQVRNNFLEVTIPQEIYFFYLHLSSIAVQFLSTIFLIVYNLHQTFSDIDINLYNE